MTGPRATTVNIALTVMTILFVNKVYIIIHNAQTACFIMPIGQYTEFTVNIATSRWTSNTTYGDFVVLSPFFPFKLVGWVFSVSYVYGLVHDYNIFANTSS